MWLVCKEARRVLLPLCNNRDSQRVKTRKGDRGLTTFYSTLVNRLPS
jgi:hypothetical protein